MYINCIVMILDNVDNLLYNNSNNKKPILLTGKRGTYDISIY